MKTFKNWMEENHSQFVIDEGFSNWKKGLLGLAAGAGLMFGGGGSSAHGQEQDYKYIPPVNAEKVANDNHDFKTISKNMIDFFSTSKEAQKILKDGKGYFSGKYESVPGYTLHAFDMSKFPKSSNSNIQRSLDLTAMKTANMKAVHNGGGQVVHKSNNGKILCIITQNSE